jgi:hypothetical protein
MNASTHLSDMRIPYLKLANSVVENCISWDFKLRFGWTTVRSRFQLFDYIILKLNTGKVMVFGTPVYLEYIEKWEDFIRYVPKSIPSEEARSIANQTFERAESQKGENRLQTANTSANLHNSGEDRGAQAKEQALLRYE